MAHVIDRYIELSFNHPDGSTHFRAMVVVDSPSPDDALEQAIEDLFKAEPEATQIHEFMQRRLTPASSLKIRTAIADGTWQGWDFGGRPVEVDDAAVLVR